jgi:uncharacterized membrane protein YidH (DUF202 family)
VSDSTKEADIEKHPVMIKVRRMSATFVYVFALAPLVQAVDWFTGEAPGPHADRVWGGIAWLVVALAVLLVARALHRIEINVRYNRRPFTVKDHQYCYRASGAMIIAAVLLLGVEAVLILTSQNDRNSVSLVDVTSAQLTATLVLGMTMRTMAIIHGKGMQYFEELEKGV